MDLGKELGEGRQSPGCLSWFRLGGIRDSRLELEAGGARKTKDLEEVQKWSGTSNVREKYVKSRKASARGIR